VEGQESHPGEPSGNGYCLGDGIGDVTELEVQEDARNEGRELLDGCRPNGGEQLVSYLDQSKTSFELLNNADGLWQAAKVQGDNQLAGCFAFDEGTSSSSSLTCARPR
jgi:hypothetical protein